MSRIRVAAAALLLSVSGSTMAAGAGLPIPIPTLPGLALGQLPGLPGLPALGLSLPGLPGLGLVSLPGLALLPGSVDFVDTASGFAAQLPLVGLVEAGDPMLRPLITPLSDAVYIPVLGAAFGNN